MNRIATFSLAVLLGVPAVGCTQDRNDGNPTAAKEPARGKISRADAQQENGDKIGSQRRLETVTWNSVNHELTWVVSRGQRDENGRNFKAAGEDRYLIRMDRATMDFHGESRRFSKQEAANVHVLMDLIAKYAIDSTIWWDQGQGEPVDGNKTPADTEDDPPLPERKKDLKDSRVIRVSAPSGGLSGAELDRRICETEEQLAALKRLRALAGTSVQPAAY